MKDFATLYSLENTINGMRYIGVTTNKLSARLSEHYYKLKNGTHNKKMQEDFYKYGKTAFVMVELDSGIIEKMYSMEEELTIKLNNIYNVIDGGRGTKQFKQAASIFRKMLENNAEYKENLYKRISLGNKGKFVSLETKEKISISRKGCKVSQEFREKRSKRCLGVGNPNFGKLTLHLNLQTGVYYNYEEMCNLLSVCKSKLLIMKRTKNSLVSNFLKV